MTAVATHCPYCALQCGLNVSGGAPPTVAARNFPVNGGGLCQPEGLDRGHLADLTGPLDQPAGPGRGRRVFGFFLVLFVTSGIGNGSTYRMIPAIFARRAAILAPEPADRPKAMRQARREAAAVIGVASSIGAFGGFGVTRTIATSVGHTKSADAAFYGFIAFYVVCFLVTWAAYLRRSRIRVTVTRRPVAADREVAQV